MCPLRGQSLESRLAAQRSVERTVRKKKHADGTPCLDGIPSVPRGFKPCCEAFGERTHACVFDIRFEWWSRTKTWVIRVADGGSSGLGIASCPFCSTKIKGVRGSRSVGRRFLSEP